MKYTYMIDLFSTTTIFNIHDGHEYTATNLVTIVHGDKIMFDGDYWCLWANGLVVASGAISGLKSTRNYRFKVGKDDYTACNFKYTAYDRISV